MTDQQEALLTTVNALRAWCSANTDGGIIPDHMLYHVADYLLFGHLIDPDDDLLGLLIQDAPFSAVAPIADDQNRRALLTWHRLLFNLFPSEAWRSRGAMLDWMAKGGTGGVVPPTLSQYVRRG